MKKEIRRFVNGCAICKRNKTPLRPKCGFTGEYGFTDEPFAYLHTDHIGPISPPSGDGHSYILTVIDRATNYVLAIPVADVTAETTAKMIWEHVLCKTGVPTRIISDR